MIISQTVRVSTKILIMIYAGWHSPSNDITMNVVVNDPGLNFEGQTFQVAILTSIGWKNESITIVIR